MNAAVRLLLSDSKVETEMPETDLFAGAVPVRDGAAPSRGVTA